MDKKTFINTVIDFCQSVGNGSNSAMDDYGYETMKISEVEAYLEYLTEEGYPEDRIRPVNAFLEAMEGIPEMTLFEEHGGMDQGSDYWVIWKIEHLVYGELFVKHQGWYASHVGHEFQDAREVRAVEKIVTVYDYA